MTSKTRIIDLSIPIFHDMPIWSNEPKISVTDFFKLGRRQGDDEIMNMKLLVMCGHAGTHTDAPSHMRADGWTLDQVPLERYYGPARVLDFTHKKPGEQLEIADLLPYEKLITPGCRILIRTGWDKHLGTSLYFEKEQLIKMTPELLRWFNTKQVGLVGVDTPSVNPYIDRHAAIFSSETPPIVVELLTNLDQLPTDREITLICLPLKIREGDGSPVRAVAIVEA
jgi:arylformamidase